MAFLPTDKLDPNFGTIEQIGYTLFSGRYLLPFEVVSALLTVAVLLERRPCGTAGDKHFAPRPI